MVVMDRSVVSHWHPSEGLWGVLVQSAWALEGPIADGLSGRGGRHHDVGARGRFKPQVALPPAALAPRPMGERRVVAAWCPSDGGGLRPSDAARRACERQTGTGRPTVSHRYQPVGRYQAQGHRSSERPSYARSRASGSGSVRLCIRSAASQHWRIGRQDRLLRWGVGSTSEGPYKRWS